MYVCVCMSFVLSEMEDEERVCRVCLCVEAEETSVVIHDGLRTGGDKEEIQGKSRAFFCFRWRDGDASVE